jgi:flavodoxin
MKNTKNYKKLKERRIIMKRLIALATTLVLILMFAGCAASNTESQSKAETKAAAANTSETEKATPAENTDKNKALVAYFSATGTTERVAKVITDCANADIYEITAAKPYTSADLDYNDSNSRTTKEQNDNTVRPEIGSKKIDLERYDTIFIGFPIWWGEEPRITDTFVESYDLTGKTVIPFCTSGGSSIDSAEKNLKANAGGGDWKDGRRFSAEVTKNEIDEWLKTL